MLKKKKVHFGWIVYRHNGNSKQHTHFNNRKGADGFLWLMNNKILPYNKRLLESARRVLTEKELKALRYQKKKQKYVNKR